MILRLNTDIAAGGFGLAFAALLWLPRGEMGRLSIIFPRAILVLLTVVAVALIVKGLVRPGDRRIEITGSPRRLLVVAAGFFAWWVAIGQLGFLVSSLVAVFALVWYLARVAGPVSLVRLARWVPIILGLVVAFYLIFTQVLNVRLPTGLLI
ncbi:tripartite tricarboxylate transporter TctB family protein [Halomonas ramblicola]|uniref:tripartite tricarboxylate transporter TctB family protein n=1 Tax=Halomonas ramblicola TaxID=747349 RepID=UPI0025B484E5|nr:tripartite tricarboxylate transporter TctB family protein [Halomonas ramblicola]MDN3519936.1 tripartite tricarboxylate transporter TctB family protein [Halomonas ramblicola]